MIQRHASNDWSIARYNPWSYSTVEQAILAFFSELQQAMPDDPQNRRKQLLGKWASRLVPLTSVGSLLGVDPSGPLAALADLIVGDRSPERLHSDAKTSLRELTKPVLMVLDDLDRLEPDQLLLTFKLVRMLGRLPNVYYLLSYDEDTLLDVLQRSGLVSDNKARARSYLEKMVQVRLDVPPVLPSQRLTLMNSALTSVLASNEILLDTQATERLSRAWTCCLESYLNQPRSIKRLMTQVDAFWPEVAGEVDFVDYVAMVFLTTFERGVFDLVLANRAELTSPNGTLLWALPTEKESHEERLERWRKSVGSLDVRHPERILDLLTELFLPLRGARENRIHTWSTFEDLRKRQAVGHPDYFHRYIVLGLPQDDLADSTVTKALSDFAEHKDTPETQSFLDQLALDPRRALTKARDQWELMQGATIPLLRIFVEHYRGSKSIPTVGFEPPKSSAIASATEELLAALQDAQATDVIKSMTTSDDGLILASDILWGYASKAASEVMPWISQSIAIVSTAIEKRLDSVSRDEFRSNQTGIFACIWPWRHFTSPDYVREYMWKRLDGADWDLEDALALIVPIQSVSGGEGQFQQMSELDRQSVESFLGLKRAADALPPSETSEDDLRRERGKVEWHDRRSYGRAALRAMIDGSDSASG
jgi:hypothetical protein